MLMEGERPLDISGRVMFRDGVTAHSAQTPEFLHWTTPSLELLQPKRLPAGEPIIGARGDAWALACAIWWMVARRSGELPLICGQGDELDE